MGKRKMEFTSYAATLIALCLVSLYRQRMAHDLLCPWIVWAVYLGLLLGWLYSIHLRFTQKSMRRFLFSELAVMIFWMTVRFLQEAVFIQHSLYLTRVSGYWIILPVVFIPLLGLFAAFGLGQGEEYHIKRQWFLLAVPAALLVLLAVTNEHHQLLFQAYNGEVDLYFHPGPGFWLLLAFPVALVLGRIALLYWRSSQLSRGVLSRYKYLPLILAAAMPLYALPYLAASFVVDWEPVEFSAGLFFLEAMLWESSAVVGLIPVNTRYEEMFRRSSAAMQILSDRGEVLVRSERAQEISQDYLDRLRSEGMLQMPDRSELYLHPIRGGTLIWRKDLSQIHAAIEALKKTQEELDQEGILLREELRIRSEEAKAQAQNQIYDQLTEEIGDRLTYLGQLLESGLPDHLLFPRLFLAGTYVKRRCGLRLTGWQTGTIPPEDLRLCLRDMTEAMRRMGTAVRLVWYDLPVSVEFALFAVDTLEILMEEERFELAEVDIERLPDGAVAFTLRPIRELFSLPAEKVSQANRQGFHVVWQALPGGCRLTLREGGQTP